MNFYEMGPRQGFAGYWPEKVDGRVGDERIPEDSRQIESLVREYLGDPPRKPGKAGDFHKSAYSFFVRSDALELFRTAARGNLTTHPTEVIGREGEKLDQVWVTNFVDCLDVAKTVASPRTDNKPGRIGVIKRAVFDEAKWDGSDLFVVPHDPSYCLFVSEKFVEQWKASKFKGAMFTRFLMDPDAIMA